MKIEIINKPMLCWDDYEPDAVEYHVLARITNCAKEYQYAVVANENTFNGYNIGKSIYFENAKPLEKVTEMTVGEISKALGKTIKIIE